MQNRLFLLFGKFYSCKNFAGWHELWSRHFFKIFHIIRRKRRHKKCEHWLGTKYARATRVRSCAFYKSCTNRARSCGDRLLEIVASAHLTLCWVSIRSINHAQKGDKRVSRVLSFNSAPCILEFSLLRSLIFGMWVIFSFLHWRCDKKARNMYGK